MLGVHTRVERGGDRPATTELSADAVRALSARSFRRWVWPVILEWTAIVLLFAVGFWIDRIWAWAAIIVLLGSRQNGLGVLGHDGSHYLAANNRRLNEVASEALCFWPVMTGIDDFRGFHFAHHRHFNTSQDPEIIFKMTMSKA